MSAPFCLGEGETKFSEASPPQIKKGKPDLVRFEFMKTMIKTSLS